MTSTYKIKTREKKNKKRKFKGPTVDMFLDWIDSYHRLAVRIKKRSYIRD